MKYPLIIGNWKLNGNKCTIVKLINDLKQNLLGVKGCKIAIAPPLIYLDQAKCLLENTDIELVAQNVDVNKNGSFTGDISADMLKDIGVKYILIGHSERRRYHNESNTFIAKKFTIIKEVGLIPVLCIGETEEERQARKTQEVCITQLESIFELQGISILEDAIIAYEPIWAIGTGKSATPSEVQKTHKFIRNYISSIDFNISQQLVIQYGGSVNNKNALAFFMQPDIDGVLVGNASLNAEIFADIIKCAVSIKKY
ncbi:triose-phosphate isomerase [Candidatus Ishikawella capsulata]|uniref:Triosephosphate isomerase n=1 Tax=Candidatus Ishikawaella capsulata Mpkobe TaxID=476281 RepID=C5WDR6_9ENTR|nr:triose-phosphate isomerase [Candidatus Ishikawaella capsulata]BAH83472.1 triosephosphate isomerase [Candidatus Ishikawaella capsulata Mpkobe]